MANHESPEESQTAELAEDARQRRGESLLTVRREHVPVPKFNSQDEADAWVNNRLALLSPAAVAELEYQMMFDEDKRIRRDLALEILDRTGHAKGERPNVGGDVIILNGVLDAPWSTKKRRNLPDLQISNSQAPIADDVFVSGETDETRVETKVNEVVDDA